MLYAYAYIQNYNIKSMAFVHKMCNELDEFGKEKPHPIGRMGLKKE